MGDDLSLNERNSVRTPMQWSGAPHGGFTSAPRQAQIRPVIRHRPYGYEAVNMESQRRDPESLLNWLERAIRTRKACPEFGFGTWRILDTGDPAVLARSCQWRGGRRPRPPQPRGRAARRGPRPEPRRGDPPGRALGRPAADPGPYPCLTPNPGWVWVPLVSPPRDAGIMGPNRPGSVTCASHPTQTANAPHHLIGIWVWSLDGSRSGASALSACSSPSPSSCRRSKRAI